MGSEKSLSESRKQRRLAPTEAASEHGLRCVGSLEASISIQFLATCSSSWRLGIRQGVVMKSILAASESAERGSFGSDKEELCLLELGSSKCLSA